ncbi:hypothetical protein [Streptomyces fulvoviolaceus]|uniref:hypothetical protein n=1 Tax=Streptomyces fulvoviolaceus TaxID=285535 RepID=UPI000997BDEB|nr:hypothetical protein [Streptomyces fulvoviolaceus]MCT9078246.1 hypothetical protein [Streptomyces fulvoviolaceus]
MKTDGRRLRRVLRRPEQRRGVDLAVATVLALVDVVLFGVILLLGSDGVFTEDWLGYPGPMDSTSASYQYDCVMFLCRLEAVTVGLAVTFRLWTAAATQLVLLTASAAFIASLSTYWNP